MSQPENNIYLISRTDSIGDVVLTLPIAGFIKKKEPTCKIIFLGRTYTRDVVQLSEHVDLFLDYSLLEKLEMKEQIRKLNEQHITHFIHVFPVKEIAALAKKAKIPFRIGTTNRLYHWGNCNHLVSLSRKNSTLHEAQLNIKLLAKLFDGTDLGPEEITNLYGFTKVKPLVHQEIAKPDAQKYNVILHPKSKGSAVEWGLANFNALIKLLPADKFRVFISGTEAEGKLMTELIDQNPEVIDLTGKFTLDQFISFIACCDALVAASTGPLHIAAALQKKAIGLFSSRRPIHPGRWKPLGKNAQALVHDVNCLVCKSGKECDCIKKISPQQVVNLLT